MLLDAIAMYVLLSSYKGRNKGIIINHDKMRLEILGFRSIFVSFI